MKRFVISLSLILLFIFAVILFDGWYIKTFKKEMNQGIDAIIAAENQAEFIAAGERLRDSYNRRKIILSKLVFTNRMEEMQTLVDKLMAYLDAENESEILATAAELRARINLLRS